MEREKDVLYSPIKMCGGFLLMISMVSLFIYLIFLKKVNYKLMNNRNKKSLKLRLDGFLFK